MSDKILKALIDEVLGPGADNLNDSGILQTPSSNSNDSGDLATAPPKSPPIGNLQIAPPPPTLEDRLDRANQSARCEHVKPNGIRCGSPALRNEHYCYFHRVWRPQADLQPFRPDPNGHVWALPILENADGIQMALQLVLDSVLCNKMDLKRASILLYGLQTAASNVRRTQFDVFHSSISTELK